MRALSAQLRGGASGMQPEQHPPAGESAHTPRQAPAVFPPRAGTAHPSSSRGGLSARRRPQKRDAAWNVTASRCPGLRSRAW